MVEKKLTYIQELERKKAEYHEQKHKEKYPDGVFSVQIRYGSHGFDDKDAGLEKSIQLRWGIKSGPQHYAKSFVVGRTREGEIYFDSYINNSFQYTYNYPTMEKLLAKCKRECVAQELVDAFLHEFNTGELQKKAWEKRMADLKKRNPKLWAEIMEKRK